MEYKIFKSGNSDVQKFVFEWNKDDNKKDAVAESVLYKYGTFKERTVICCSVQSGCPVGCVFCGTGKFFKRNLTSYEIVEQVKTVIEAVDCNTKDIKKFQIMFMSMGEPFCNYSNLEMAIIELNKLYSNADLLVSTSAPSCITEYIDRFITLSKNIKKIGLQFSVHESTNINRKKLIPTSTCLLMDISILGGLWAKIVERKPYYNYCVHSGNNTNEDADRLVRLFNPKIWETTLSVICEKDESVKSSIERQLDLINDFKSIMIKNNASLRVFNPAGQDDIGGGCGQLWYFQEWLKNNTL